MKTRQVVHWLRIQWAFSLCWLIACCCAANVARGDAKPWFTVVHLKGQSSGGTLALGHAVGANSPYVVVTNQPGDTAATVIGRLAAQLQVEATNFGCNVVSAKSESHGELSLLGVYPWMYGGTDSGFNTPPPVTSLSATWIEEGRKVVLRWVNPPGGYDRIYVMYPMEGILGGLRGLPGNATEYVHCPRDPSEPLLWSSDVTAIVVGYNKDATPSNGTAIRFLNHASQECLMNFPFTQGLAPGFRSWLTSDSTGKTKVEQAELPATNNTLREHAGKFFQAITVEGTVCGGVCRTFIGLTAGHTYRASARLNTLRSKAGDWSWSFHATANSPGQNTLTPEQMSGNSELPNHTKGPEAGQIARYDSAKSTKGKWVTCSSGAHGLGNSIGDITLSGGSDSITLWFRIQGTNVTQASVGLDSVVLEDLGHVKED